MDLSQAGVNFVYARIEITIKNDSQHIDNIEYAYGTILA